MLIILLSYAKNPGKLSMSVSVFNKIEKDQAVDHRVKYQISTATIYFTGMHKVELLLLL